MPLNPSRPRIGIIGGGMISQIGHLRFYLADPRCEVVAVAESRPSLVHALGRSIGEQRIVADHRRLLEDPSIDAVVICSPRPATGPLTLEVLEAGKHVLTEKPMAHTADQADRLVEAARARGLIYAVGFMKRYDPGIRAAKAALDGLLGSGRLGRLLTARFYDYSRAYAHPVPPHTRPTESRTQRFPVWPLYPDWLPSRYREAYPWFLNAASHDMNLVTYFLGQDIEVEAASAPVGDGCVATLRAGEVPVAFEIAKTGAGVWLEGGEFMFEDGRLSFSVPSPMNMEGVTAIRLDDGVGGRLNETVNAGQGWSFALQAQGFVDCLLGEARPSTSGEDGLADMRLCEAIWRHIAR